MPTAPPPSRRSLPLVLYAHPFELAVAVVLGVSAIRTATRLEEVLGLLDPRIVLAWAAATVVGILATVVGLFGSVDLTGEDPRRRAMYRAAEKAGLWLLAAGTGAIAALLEFALPFSEAWPSDVQLGALAAACLLRVHAIRTAERITLTVLRQAHRDLDDEEAGP